MLADLVFILGVIAAVALVAWWEYFLLTDLALADQVRFLPKWLWAVLCLAQIPLGGVFYLVFGRARHQHAAPAQPGPGLS